MKKFLLLIIVLLIGRFCDAQPIVKENWRQFIKNSLNSINKANNFLIDQNGNCYVLGTTWIADSSKDILLVKIDPAGDIVWQRTYDNPSHGDDLPMNMSLDKFGNVWVCGMAKTQTNNADFLLVKFTPEGIPVVDELYDGKDRLYDCATAVTCDEKGNVYAAGYETSLDSGLNMIIAKYSQDGFMIWRQKYSTNQMDIANQLLTDDSCNVYVCGTSNNGPHTADILIQKYDSTGIKKWQIVYDGIFSQSDIGQFISADDSMNLYVSGFLNHSNNRSDIPLIKISRKGKILQENIFNGKIADCLATDLNVIGKKIYLTGHCQDYNISETSTFVVEYDKAGKEKNIIRTPFDVQFIGMSEIYGNKVVIGSKLSHPESTLMPYFGEVLGDSIVWEFADSSVYGLSNFRKYFVDDSHVYLLGDDTGDATGTIRVYKYSLGFPAPANGFKKTPAKRK